MNNTHTYCNAQRPDARQGTVTTNTDNKLINRLDIIASFNPHLTDINPQSISWQWAVLLYCRHYWYADFI